MPTAPGSGCGEALRLALYLDPGRGQDGRRRRDAAPGREHGMRSLDPPRSASAARKAAPRPRGPLAGRGPRAAPRQAPAGAGGHPAPRPADALPEGLQSVIEAMSGFSLADIVVHRNSSEPARLGAFAFTRGEQIYLAPGQEGHLPHEAWHVVQQKQGRVRSTVQRKGVAINEDEALEAEADRMGAIATQGRGEARPMASPAASRMDVVQRKAGIEYETFVEARHPLPAVAANPPLAVDDLSLLVAQDEVMAVSPGGWQVVSDNSKLEFVTDPPVDLANLPGVVANMVNVLTAIPAPLAAPAGFQAHIGIAPARPYTILPYARGVITGKLQGTVGIPFEKLPAFFTLAANYDLTMSTSRLAFWTQRGGANPSAEQQAVLAGLAEDKKAVTDAKAQTLSDIIAAVDVLTGDLRDALDNINVAATKTQQFEALEKLRGLLIFVGQYVVFSKNYETSYAKKNFPIMARTSFASMYKALNRFYRSKFLDLARRLVVQLGRQLADRAFGAHADRLHADAQFTLGEWLDSIVAGGTRFLPPAVPGGRARQMVSDRMTAPGMALNPTDASMGSMGMDAGGLVVLELRGMKGGSPPATVADLVTDLAHLAATPVRPQ